MQTALPVFGHWSVPAQTAAAATVLTVGIPPFPGPAGNPPFLYTYKLASGSKGTGTSLGTPNWTGGTGSIAAVTCVTRCRHATGTTAKNPVFMRPINFTTVATAAVAGATTVTLTDDPGIFSTNYRFKSLLGYPGNVADAGISSSHYYAVQLADGTWVFGKVTSVSTLTITIAALPTNTGTIGGVLAGAIWFHFGAPTSVDPWTNEAHPSLYTTSSTADNDSEGNYGLIASLRPGEPILYYNANATDQSWLGDLCGVYTKF